MNSTPDFVVIDDDALNNLICKKIIELSIPDACIKTFTNPETGLDYLSARYSAFDANNALLFLDINMPCLTGWEVLELISYFPLPVRDKLKIFMLSSSVNPKEEEKAIKNPLVWGYVSKSLSRSKLMEIMTIYRESVLKEVFAK